MDSLASIESSLRPIGAISMISVKCDLLQILQGLIQGAGQAYQPYFDNPMQQQLWKCLYHPNRFIRETGYEIAGDLCSIFAGQPLEGWGKGLAVKLQDGLSENWSQVSLLLSVVI